MMDDRYKAKKRGGIGFETTLNVEQFTNVEAGHQFGISEVLAVVHEALPYWIPEFEVGVDELKNNRFNERRKVFELLGEEGRMFTMAKTDPINAFTFNGHDKTWAFLFGKFYVKDPKTLTLLKVAFG